MNRRILGHLTKNNLLNDSQYGFRSARSTADALTVITHRVSQALHDNLHARAVLPCFDKTTTFKKTQFFFLSLIVSKQQSPSYEILLFFNFSFFVHKFAYIKFLKPLLFQATLTKPLQSRGTLTEPLLSGFIAAATHLGYFDKTTTIQACSTEPLQFSVFLFVCLFVFVCLFFGFVFCCFLSCVSYLNLKIISFSRISTQATLQSETNYLFTVKTTL